LSCLCSTACIVLLCCGVKKNNSDLIGLDVIQAVSEGKTLPQGALARIPQLCFHGGAKSSSGSRHMHAGSLGSLLPIILDVCWARHILGLVGFRVLGGCLNWWQIGLLGALCGFHVPHGHSTAWRWVSRAWESH